MSTMQDKITAKKLKKEDDRIKRLLLGLDAETVSKPKPVKGVPKGGLLEKKLQAKSKQKAADVKLVTDMVAAQRKAAAAKKKKATKTSGVMGNKIAAKAAEKKKKAEVASVVAQVKAKKAAKKKAEVDKKFDKELKDLLDIADKNIEKAKAKPAGKFNALTFLKKNPKVKITFVGFKGGKNAALFKKYKPAKNYEEFFKLAKAGGDATPNGHINYDFRQGYLYIHSDGVKNVAKLPSAGGASATTGAAPKN